MTAPDDFPPYPSVVLGAGQWRRILGLLEKRGTKHDNALADNVRRQCRRKEDDA